MLLTETTFTYRVAHHFADTGVSPKQWNELVRQSGGTVFQTWEYQKVWWEVFGRGQLLIVVAFTNKQPVAIAPLFAEEGMVYFVGSGGSDYLDFIGEVGEISVLKDVLQLAVEQVFNFLGFLFYHVPTTSTTLPAILDVSTRLGYDFYLEGEHEAPYLSIKDFPQSAVEATRKKSLVRHESWFRRNGKLTVEHLTKSEEIGPLLDVFFEQHRMRWAITPYPSLFNEKQHCLFYKKLTEATDLGGFVHFTVVKFNQDPVAFHYGFLHNGVFLWYKPSFNIDQAKQSPGEVLLRYLLLYAIEQDVTKFDFGLGDEAFKKRFATASTTVKNIGIYRKSTL